MAASCDYPLWPATLETAAARRAGSRLLSQPVLGAGTLARDSLFGCRPTTTTAIIVR
jgi:hypothetical protein